MSTIRVRRLDINHDPVHGQGQADFLTDKDAVAQIIQTTLLFFKGEWWEDRNAGMPMTQSILGVNMSDRKKRAADNIIQQAIMSVPYVDGIASMTSAFNSQARSYSFTASVNTQFGIIQVSA